MNSPTTAKKVVWPTATLTSIRGAVLNSTRLKIYCGIIISGLLQTPGYAQLMRDKAGDFQYVQIDSDDKLIQARLDHQQRFFDRLDKGVAGADFILLANVAAMGWVPRQQRQKQLAHIIDIAKSKKNLTIRIIPPDSEFFPWPGMLLNATDSQNNSAFYTEGYPPVITDRCELFIPADTPGNKVQSTFATNLLQDAEAAALSPQNSLQWLQDLQKSI